ncbi:MAG: oligosaccharide flippase family protein [Clostridium sp.]|nr:oligosaccharide flippase family protein [Prevotella sp.]MCM1429487.1 oligosaccharide flippase family protein [Clostridium sp.]MCM1476103.1 oligosaccharide flippase family protein [Muribaculaceae bacterium]
MKDKILKYLKHLTVYFGASLIPMILGLVCNPWVASNMSPRDYAIVGYYTSFTTLFQPIILFYLLNYYIKEFYKINEEQRAELYSIIAKGLITLSGIISLLCFGGLLGYIAIFNRDGELPVFPYIALAIFALPFTGLLSLELARLRMERRSGKFFWLSTANGLLGILLMVVMVVGLKWGAFGKLLAPMVCNIAMFIYCLIRRLDIFRYKFDFKRFKEILIFCLPLTLSSALGYFTNGYDRTYLETLSDTTTYGIYIVGSSIAMYLTTFSGAVFNTFQPDLYENIAQKRWKKYAGIVAAMTGAVLAIAILFIILAPYIIDILTAGRYIVSTPYAQIISLSTVSSTLVYIVGGYAIATDRPKIYLHTTIIGSIFIIGAMPVAVGRWGFYGGAWMTVVSFLFFVVINLILLAIDSKFGKKKEIAQEK